MTANRRPEIELPVCPTCGRVGKLPAEYTRKDYCAGGTGNPHRAVKMEKRRFVEAKPRKKAWQGAKV